MLWRVCLQLFTICAVSSAERLSGLSRNREVGICSIHDPNDAEADPVTVFLLPNNGRTFSFGEHAQTTEARVYCKGAPCSPPTSELVTVFDAADCPPCPCDVEDAGKVGPSVEVMFEKIHPLCSNVDMDEPFDILLIGLGGGTLHRRVRKMCSNATRVRSVEIDARVAGVAERFFGLELADGTSEIDVTDGLSAVRVLAADRKQTTEQTSFLSRTGFAMPPAMGTQGWDIVAVDCFIGHGETPLDCRSLDFIKDIHSILKPKGIALHHLWHYSPDTASVSGEFEAALETYREIFGHNAIEITSVPREPMWDDIVVARMG